MRLVLSLSAFADATNVFPEVSDRFISDALGVIDNGLGNLRVDLFVGTNLLPTGYACDDGIVGWWFIEGVERPSAFRAYSETGGKAFIHGSTYQGGAARQLH